MTGGVCIRGECAYRGVCIQGWRVCIQWGLHLLGGGVWVCIQGGPASRGICIQDGLHAGGSAYRGDLHSEGFLHLGVLHPGRGWEDLPQSRALQDTVNKRAVRIPLDSILVTACKRSFGQGNIFIGMCQEFCSRGGSASVHARMPPPWADTPLRADTPLGRHPPPRDKVHLPGWD